jgi:hypothetical protein
MNAAGTLEALTLDRGFAHPAIYDPSGVVCHDALIAAKPVKCLRSREAFPHLSILAQQGRSFAELIEKAANSLSMK